MEHLVAVVQDLSQARDLDTVMDLVRKAARNLTNADGATFVLRDGDKCYYAQEDAISPLWKGQRFPMKTCISGWVMLNAQPAVIEDIYADPRIPADAYRPTFVKSLAMVPIRKEKPIGAIGNYWASNHRPSDEELAILQALANATSLTLENLNLYSALQEKIRALENSNYELERFAWIAAHDLQSPLRAINHLSQWIEEDLGETLTDKTQEHLAALRKRVSRMGKLLDDVFEYSHLDQRNELQAGPLADGKTLLEETLQLVYVPPGFTVTADERFCAVKAPLKPLLRILCNLVNNAIKHHHRDSGRIELSVQEQDNQYLFSVRDDGPGIAPEYRERIFELFQTLQPRDIVEGSGMGLSIVKKMLALHGGSIAVQEAPGGGADFRFIWPRPLQLAPAHA